jgi:hypothetical protein
MGERAGALAWAEAQVAAARDVPAAQRQVWRAAHTPFAARVLERITRAR